MRVWVSSSNAVTRMLPTYPSSSRSIVVTTYAAALPSGWTDTPVTTGREYKSSGLMLECASAKTKAPPNYDDYEARGFARRGRFALSPPEGREIRWCESAPPWYSKDVV